MILKVHSEYKKIDCLLFKTLIVKNGSSILSPCLSTMACLMICKYPYLEKKHCSIDNTEQVYTLMTSPCHGVISTCLSPI